MNNYSVRIRSLIRALPLPHAIYHNKDETVVFEMYQVKGLGSQFWRDPALKDFLLESRESYKVYGNRRQLDPYDNKAAIYLVRASYATDDGGERVEEWLSTRLVPGIGDPLGAGELEIYFHQGKPMDYWLSAHLGCGDVSFWKQVLSSSRMCGINPYIPGKGGEEVVNYREKHKYTPICNALIRAQFLVDTGYKIPYRAVTAILRKDLHEKGLKVTVGQKEIIPTYTEAHEFLGIKDKHAIRLDRRAYAYEFPSYWLNMGQLKCVLLRLLKEGKLSEESLNHCFPGAYNDANLIELLAYNDKIPESKITDEGRKKIRALRSFEANLGALLTIDGRIPDSEMTGEELRALVDLEVEEEPILRITDARAWFGSYLRILDVTGVDIFAQHPELSKFL